MGSRVCSVSTNERPSLTGILLGEEGPPSQGDRYSQDDHMEPSSNEIRLIPNMILSGRKIFKYFVRQNVARDSDVKGKKTQRGEGILQNMFTKDDIVGRN